ncbi:MAG: hypothetical protein QG599_699 [Pseudomonadota bacterium]|nr:hypothetical protein [Pseudomonadota bacterium]
MPLKGSRTEENLKAAFISEAQANETQEYSEMYADMARMARLIGNRRPPVAETAPSPPPATPDRRSVRPARSA